MGPNDIYISYSRKDLAFTAMLDQTLTQQGFSVWFDKENIQLADFIRTNIIEAIQFCKVFILVLSPGSVASINVLEEVYLAERQNKKVLPLMWRATSLPVSLQFLLDGLPYVDFRESASVENFNGLVGILKKIIADDDPNFTASDIGRVFDFGTSGSSKVVESTVASSMRRQNRLLGGRKSVKNSRKSPVASASKVIDAVVTSMRLDTDTQDFVNEELKWLLYATDHILKVKKVKQGDVDAHMPVPTPIPRHAVISSGADNTILSSVSDIDWIVSEVERVIARVNLHLDNLNIGRAMETQMGWEARSNIKLQNELKGYRLEVIKLIQELTRLMKQTYGIEITSPYVLEEYLDAF